MTIKVHSGNIGSVIDGLKKLKSDMLKNDIPDVLKDLSTLARDTLETIYEDEMYRAEPFQHSSSELSVDIFGLGGRGDHAVGDKRQSVVVQAMGSQVAFLEFGAGVYYNRHRSFPYPRPEGVVDIGEWGYGRGKRNLWFFYNEYDGALVTTRGYRATFAMWEAMKELEDEAGDTVRKYISFEKSMRGVKR